jgi:hypothetical protein
MIKSSIKKIKNIGLKSFLAVKISQTRSKIFLYKLKKLAKKKLCQLF